ncbi:hypothetical protein JXA40_08430, partial [bacterium]|nr:hypothetical protein [candidate division CSSED10-310 bacterium]
MAGCDGGWGDDDTDESGYRRMDNDEDHHVINQFEDPDTRWFISIGRTDPNGTYTRFYTRDLGTGDYFDYKIWTPELISANTWCHIAFERSQGNMMVFYNGILVDSRYYSETIADADADLYIGYYPHVVDPHYANCKIDELRITKGTARWTEDFTPPARPYERSTKLLLHFDDDQGATTFIDDSLSGHVVTPEGDVHMEGDTGEWDSHAVFDGDGDYLSLADNDDWDLGDGNFTIDFRVNFSSLPDSGGSETAWMVIIDQYLDDGNNWALGLEEYGGSNYRWGFVA